MPQRIFNLFNREVRGIHQAAYLLGIFAIISQLLALLRDHLLAGAFGAGATLDLYYASFRLPDLLFAGIASLVSVYVLIPFFSQKVEGGGGEARAFLSTMLTGYVALIGIASLIVFFAAPYLLPRVFPGFATQSHELVFLTRLLLLQPILLGLSSLIGTITQHDRKFFLYAFSPILYNVGIILGIAFLYPLWGLPGLIVGVIVGALMHVGIQVPYTLSTGYFPVLTKKASWREFRQVVTLSLPRTIALSANQVALLVIATLAGGITAGSIAVFNLALNLQSVPLSVIGVSYSVAAFPTLARLFSLGERDAFFAQISAASRHIIFWSLPTLSLFIVLRAQIVRTILGSGAFNWNDTRLTAAAVAIFVVSLLAQGLVLLIVRGYYAAGRTAVPLIINVGSALLSIVFSLYFLYLFRSSPAFASFTESLLRVSGIEGTAVLMLPLGYMLAQIGNAVALFLLFERDFRRFASELLSGSLQSFCAAVVMGLVAYLLLNIFDTVFDITTFVGIFSQGLFSGLGAIVVGVVVLWVLRNQELSEIAGSLRSRIFTAPATAPDEIEPTV